MAYEMVPRFKTLVLAEEPGLVPRTHISVHSLRLVTSIPGNPTYSSGIQRHQACMHCANIHAGKHPYIHNNKYKHPYFIVYLGME